MGCLRNDKGNTVRDRARHPGVVPSVLQGAL